MCEASPPAHPPRGPCGTLAEAERVVAAARVAALRARLGTDDGGAAGAGGGTGNVSSSVPSSSSPAALTSSSSSSPPLLLTRVHPSLRLFVGGVTSARCLLTLRANGVTHVVNATTCLPHFHEGRAVVEGEGGKKKAATTASVTKDSKASSTSPSSSTPSSSFCYLRVPIYDDASQDLGPHLESALAFIDAGLRFSNGNGSSIRRRRRQQEENEDADAATDELDLDFDFDLSDSPSPSPSPSTSGGVLIHCVGGVSRSAALAAAWLVSRAGATAEGAVAAVKRARPLAAPNSGFLEQLCGLEADVAAAAAAATRAASSSSRHRHGKRRETDREFSHRLAELLLLRAAPSGSVVVTATSSSLSSDPTSNQTTTSSNTTSRPISVPHGKLRGRSSSTMALSLLPSPVTEEEEHGGTTEGSSDASAKKSAAAIDDDEAERKKRLPRATSAFLRKS